MDEDEEVFDVGEENEEDNKNEEDLDKDNSSDDTTFVSH